MAFRTFYPSLHSLQIYIFVAQRQVFIEWRKQSLATSVMIHEGARHNLGGEGELLSTPLASDSRLDSISFNVRHRANV